MDKLDMANQQNDDMVDFFDVLNRFVEGLSQCRSCDSRESLSLDGEDPLFVNPNNLEDLDIKDSFILLKLRNSLQEILHDLMRCKQNILNTSSAYSESIEDSTNNSDCYTSQFGDIALGIARELLHFHKCATSKLVPVVQYGSQEDEKDKDTVLTAWRTISEANKSLRSNYGLERRDIQQMLSWLHGKDLPESSRKHLNSKVDSLIQEYKTRLSHVTLDDVDIPAPFCQFPDGLDDVLRNCCSDVECLAAGSQEIPQTRDEFESLILREIPQTKVQITDDFFDVASPGKAFENSRLKMHAARNLTMGIAKSLNLEASKEQLELFSLKLLATTCLSMSHFACRTAVVLAYGKKNLIKVKPCPSKSDSGPAVILGHGGVVVVRVPSTWWLCEDDELFASIREIHTTSTPIAVVNAVYELGYDVFATITNGDEPLPTVHVELSTNLDADKDGIFINTVVMGSKTLRKQFSKATSKLFNWKQSPLSPFLSRCNSASERILQHLEKDVKNQTDDANTKAIDKEIKPLIDKEKSLDKSVSLDSLVQDGPGHPLRPPRPRRAVKKMLHSRSQSLGGGFNDGIILDTDSKDKNDWFLSPSCVPSKTNSCAPLPDKPPAAVASFKELQEVINFLSSSSTSSVCIGASTEDAKNGSADKVAGVKGRNKGRESRKRKSKQKKKAQQAINQADNKTSSENIDGSQTPIIGDSGIGSNASVHSAGSDGTVSTGMASNASGINLERSTSIKSIESANSSITNDKQCVIDSCLTDGIQDVLKDDNVADNRMIVRALSNASAERAALKGHPPTMPGQLSFEMQDGTHGTKSSPKIGTRSQESLYYSSCSLNDFKPFKDGGVDHVLSGSLTDVFHKESKNVPLKHPIGSTPTNYEWPNHLNSKLASIWREQDPLAEVLKPDIWSSALETRDSRSVSSLPHTSWKDESSQMVDPLPIRLPQRSNSFRHPQQYSAASNHNLSWSHEQLPWEHPAKFHLRASSESQQQQTLVENNPVSQWIDVECKRVVRPTDWPPQNTASSKMRTNSLSCSALSSTEYQWKTNNSMYARPQPIKQDSPMGWPTRHSTSANFPLDPNTETFTPSGVLPTRSSYGPDKPLDSQGISAMKTWLP